MTGRIRARLAGTVLILAAAGTLSGCDSLKSALGTDKQPPDEFAVVTKAPLIIPPDFNLRPPKPGAPPANQVSPTQSAQAALFNADPATTAASMPGDMSMGEKLLLSYAGAANADGSIRQVIAAENKKLQASDDGFTDSLMFWKGPTAPAEAVDPDAEAKKQAAQKADPTIQKDPGTNNAP
jgi:hypothetical protein